MSGGYSHWHLQASLWQRIASPLRPVAEDLEQNARWALPVLDAIPGPRTVAILGVTPELALMPWPDGTRIIGIDRAWAMAHGIWPHTAMEGRGLAINGDWRHLPVVDHSLAWIIGDGSLSMLDPISDYDRLLGGIARALLPAGRFSVRLYIGPDRPESPATVIESLLDGEMDNFHAFKLRLAMAMCAPDDHTVRVGDVFTFWQARQFDYDALERRLGIPRALIETIDNYRNSDLHYNFPPAAFVEQALTRHFRIEDRMVPSYTFGERCPTLLLAPR